MFSQQVVSTTALMNQLHQLQYRRITGSMKLCGNHYLSWTLYFLRGHCIWISGGAHPQERWQRHLDLFLPQVSQTELAQIACPPSPYREYLLLGQLFQEGLLAAQQWRQLLGSLIVEGLFDIIQYTKTSEQSLSYQIISHHIPDLGAPLFPTDQLRMEALLAWQQWQQAGLATYSPNLFPVLSRPSLLLEYASSEIYQLIRTQIDGTRSLRLIAKNSRRDVLSLTKSLVPLADIGALSFSSLPSFKRFKLPTYATNQSVSLSNSTQKKSGPLVACVDDSQMVCQTVKTILARKGYRFLGIQQSVNATTILLKSKPDLIFLDLLMPIVNGYQLCGLLRKVSSLKKVPIVFLTAKDGFIDRVRAKVVGGSSYLSKPVSSERVLEIVEKYVTARNRNKLLI